MKPRFRSLRTRLAFWFLVVALVPLICVFTLVYFQRVEARKAEAYAKLTAIRDIKVRELRAWLAERRGDLLVIAQDLEMRRLEDPFNANAPTVAQAKLLDNAREILGRYLLYYEGFSELFIVDIKHGHIELSTDRRHEGSDHAHDSSFTEPFRTKALFIKDIYHSRTLKQPAMALSIPMHCAQHDDPHVFGVLVARIDLENSLYPRLLDRTGMGETGETLIVNREGLALNELRFHERAPLRLKITARPATLGARGETGIIEVEDYRKEMVLAAYTHISETGWGFVSKQDLREIHRPIVVMLQQLLLVLAVSAALVILVAVVLARTLSRPILAMSRVAEKIQSGDLDTRYKGVTTDEIAALGHSLNSMTNALASQALIRGGQALIAEAIVESSNLAEFAKRILESLTEVTDSQLGAIFRVNQGGDRFDLLCGIGVAKEQPESLESQNLVGQLGAAMTTRRISYIDQLPAETVFRFKTLAGESIPKELVTIPLIANQEIRAVVVMASLTEYTEEHRRILDLSWSSLNTALSNILSGDEVERTATELKKANEKLHRRTLELQERAAELSQLADELETQRTQVEQADRLKTEFLSNMSHELRTPLNSVLALSQLMISRGVGKNPEQEEEYLEVITRNGRHLLNLINDLLDLSKVEAGRMDTLLSDFLPGDMVLRVAATARPLAEEKGLGFRTQIPSRQSAMFSDAEKIRQILINLLSNAVKFTDKGEVLAAVNVTGDKVHFSVTDTGIGIPQDQLRNIFDEFRQADGSTTRRYGGTGLGLAISEKLATLLGGRIDVESSPMKGSKFTLVLPRRLEKTDDQREAGQGPDQLSRGGEIRAPGAEDGEHARRRLSGGATVLVVEDNPDNQLVVTAILEELGVRFVTAKNGLEAIELARQVRPGLILLDIHLPLLSGFEAIRIIRSDLQIKDTPIVAVTARAMKQDRQRILEAGCDGCLFKPLNPSDLKQTVAEWIGHSGEENKDGQAEEQVSTDC